VIAGAPVIAGADRPGRASGSRSIRVRGPWWSPITMVEPDYGMERCPCGRRSCALPDARCPQRAEARVDLPGPPRERHEAAGAYGEEGGYRSVGSVMGAAGLRSEGST